jgi:hypothetical protein
MTKTRIQMLGDQSVAILQYMLEQIKMFKAKQIDELNKL